MKYPKAGRKKFKINPKVLKNPKQLFLTLKIYGVLKIWRKRMSELINKWMNYGGNFRTALATSGLLTIWGTVSHHLALFIITDDFHIPLMGANKILQSKDIMQALQWSNNRTNWCFFFPKTQIRWRTKPLRNPFNHYTLFVNCFELFWSNIYSTVKSGWKSPQTCMRVKSLALYQDKKNLNNFLQYNTSQDNIYNDKHILSRVTQNH